MNAGFVFKPELIFNLTGELYKWITMRGDKFINLYDNVRLNVVDNTGNYFGFDHDRYDNLLLYISRNSSEQIIRLDVLLHHQHRMILGSISRIQIAMKDLLNRYNMYAEKEKIEKKKIHQVFSVKMFISLSRELYEFIMNNNNKYISSTGITIIVGSETIYSGPEKKLVLYPNNTTIYGDESWFIAFCNDSCLIYDSLQELSFDHNAFRHYPVQKH